MNTDTSKIIQRGIATCAPQAQPTSFPSFPTQLLHETSPQGSSLKPWGIPHNAHTKLNLDDK